jgi:hypothetical protein
MSTRFSVLFACLLASSAPSAAQTSQPAQPPAPVAIDPLQFVMAPSHFPLGEGVKVGMRVDTSTQTGGGAYTMSYFVAVVGDTKDAWMVETNQQIAGLVASFPQLKGVRLGLMVRKKDGKVLKAVVGKAGEEPKAAKSLPNASVISPSATSKPASTEEFALPSGKKVQANVTKGAGYTTWVGSKGTPLEGVVFKVSGTHLSYALKQDPSEEKLVVEHTDAKDGKLKRAKIPAWKMVYDNGQVTWTSSDPVVRALSYGQLLSEKTDGKKLVYRVRITRVETKAKPSLLW